MCLCIYVFICLCIYVFMYLCIYIFMYSCIYVFMYHVFMYIRMHIHMCISMYIQVFDIWQYVPLHVCMYRCMPVFLYLTTMIDPFVYLWPFITCMAILKETNSSSYPSQICVRTHPCSLSRDWRIKRSLGVCALQRFPILTRQRGERFLSSSIFSRLFCDPIRFKGFIVLRMG